MLILLTGDKSASLFFVSQQSSCLYCPQQYVWGQNLLALESPLPAIGHWSSQYHVFLSLSPKLKMLVTLCLQFGHKGNERHQFFWVGPLFFFESPELPGSSTKEHCSLSQFNSDTRLCCWLPPRSILVLAWEGPCREGVFLFPLSFSSFLLFMGWR